MKYMPGKAVLCMQSFNYLLASSLKHFLTKRQRVLSGCAGPITLCENTFPCFRLNVYSFDLFKCVSHGTWPIPPIYMSSVGRGWSSSFCDTRGGGGGHASGHGGPVPTIEAKLALSLLYVSEVLFQHCVFIIDSNTKVQWVEVSGFLLLVIGNWCHLLNMMVVTHFVMLVTIDDPA